MIKKIALAAIFILFLNGCNYEPIYSLKNEKFSIGNLQSTGDKKINKLLTKKLEIYKNNDSNKIKYNLNITSEIIKSTASKDKKGNPTKFSMKIIINLEIIENEISKTSINFDNNFEYNNKSNKFDLKQYEKNIKDNLISKLSNEIIKYLNSLK